MDRHIDRNMRTDRWRCPSQTGLGNSASPCRIHAASVFSHCIRVASMLASAAASVVPPVLHPLLHACCMRCSTRAPSVGASVVIASFHCCIRVACVLRRAGVHCCIRTEPDCRIRCRIQCCIHRCIHVADYPQIRPTSAGETIVMHLAMQTQPPKQPEGKILVCSSFFFRF